MSLHKALKRSTLVTIGDISMDGRRTGFAFNERSPRLSGMSFFYYIEQHLGYLAVDLESGVELESSVVGQVNIFNGVFQQMSARFNARILLNHYRAVSLFQIC